MRVRAAGERRRQRVLDLRPRPLLLRGAQRRRAPDHADDQAGRRSGRRSTGTTALDYVARRPDAASRPSTAPQAIGALASPHSTVEELHLLAKLMRGLGSENIDYPPAPRRFRADGTGRRGALARACRSPRCRRCSASSSSARSCARTIRCSRSACARRRKQGRAGASACMRCDDDWLMPMAAQHHRGAERAGSQALADVAAAVAAGQGRRRAGCRAHASDEAQAIAAVAARRRAQGRAARQRRRAASAGRRSCSRWRSGSPSRPAPRVGYLGEAANTVGAQLVGALPRRGRPERRRRCSAQPLKAFLLLERRARCSTPPIRLPRARGAGSGARWWSR